MKLTAHFDSREFRCRHCGAVKASGRLVAALEELRAVLGRPIYINSAYRCAEHNKKVGGVKESQHLLGRAADIWVAGLEPQALADAAEHVAAFAAGGIGIYDTFVHVDIRTNGPVRWDERSINK